MTSEQSKDESNVSDDKRTDGVDTILMSDLVKQSRKSDLEVVEVQMEEARLIGL